MNKSDFFSLRKKIISRSFGNLNDMQKEAVFSTEGPLLVLAGAGSGKTTVLIDRVINILTFGKAYFSEDFMPVMNEEEECLLYAAAEGKVNAEEVEYLLSDSPAKPWEILAITFTNKAAGELKERLAKKIGPDADSIWASTFHSACVKILRKNHEMLGYSSNFTIYDTDDCKRVIKDCIKEYQKSNFFDEKLVPVKYIVSEISKAKTYLVSPEKFTKENADNFPKSLIGPLYKMYQERLKSSDAMDFDDLLVNTVLLLQEHSDILDYYCNKFRYIMVDEYQDTNYIQYLLVKLLASKRKNICVVGDDDQSIYRFRGATIENILNFEDDYYNAKVIRLEQNYRSTQNILDAANAVIDNNTQRKGKTLWTGNGEGSLITKHNAENDIDEGFFVANNVIKGIKEGKSYSDYAVLYRMNSQSNTIEQAFVRNAIPYRIIGGHKFYDRKEIKDAIAYLSVIANPNDSVRLSRIINEPKRGIGDASVSALINISNDLGLDVLEVMKTSDEYPALSRTSKKLKTFAEMLERFIALSEEICISDLLKEVLKTSGYVDSLFVSEPDKARDRAENLDQLVNNIIKFESENENVSVNDFLQEVSLMTDIDNYNAESDTVVMMTVHAAKGLEFDTVFLVGMEETIFPSQMSLDEGEVGLEEERRLAYVAITRAKKKLYISNCTSRMLFGFTRYNSLSRFIEEIPDELIELSPENKRAANKKAKDRYDSGFRSESDTIQSKPKPANTSFNNVKKPIMKNDTVYKVGDTVMSERFGEGVVLAVTPMGNDNLLEIAFVEGQTKKLMANFAKLTMK